MREDDAVGWAGMGWSSNRFEGEMRRWTGALHREGVASATPYIAEEGAIFECLPGSKNAERENQKLKSRGGVPTEGSRGNVLRTYLAGGEATACFGMAAA